MRLNLLGLELDAARQMLRGEGIEPQVTLTSAPRRMDEERGVLRVVHATENGARLTVARFLDPLDESART